jgi:hypothetical protein
VLQKVGENIRICHQHVSDARRRAEEIVDPAARADFLDIEKRRLALAGSYEFTEKLGDFTSALPHQLENSG